MTHVAAVSRTDAPAVALPHGSLRPDLDLGLDQDRLEYEMERLPREVTTALSWYMEEEKIPQRELARRMKVTAGRVSQILSGDENLTLRTLAAVCVALGAHFQLDLVSNTGEEAPEQLSVPEQPSVDVRYLAPREVGESAGASGFYR
jgi:transcriptional regulator with XRE-family HTH domain